MTDRDLALPKIISDLPGLCGPKPFTHLLEIATTLLRGDRVAVCAPADSAILWWDGESVRSEPVTPSGIVGGRVDFIAIDEIEGGTDD